MACWHFPSNNRYGVRLVISSPPIFCILASAIERAGKGANAAAEGTEATKRRRDISVTLPTVILLLCSTYLANPSLRFHEVVGAVAVFSTSLKKIFVTTNQTQPVYFSRPEPTYEWRLGNDHRRCGS